MSLGIDPLIKDIPDFPNYQISELGNVYNKITGKELKSFQNDKHKYLYANVVLRPHIYKVVTIHRVLALAFIDNPENHPFVDHIDRNKLNNKLSNLRWCSRDQNTRNSKRKSTNTSGTTGIVKNGKYYTSRIDIDRVPISKSFPLTPKGKLQAIKWRICREIENVEFAPKVYVKIPK